MFAQVGSNETAVLCPGSDQGFPNFGTPHVEPGGAALEIDGGDVEDEPAGTFQANMESLSAGFCQGRQGAAAAENGQPTLGGDGAIRAEELVSHGIEHGFVRSLAHDEEVRLAFRSAA